MAELVGLEPKRHETTPPARFTEASLIKKLEEEGIGRPSTYEPTIETILRRGYVFRQGKALVPSFTAFAVTRLLRDHFADFVDIGFTAEMEKDLDEISNGERAWIDFIREFFRGDGKQHRGLEAMARDGEQQIDYPVVDIGVDPGERPGDPRPHRAVRPVRAGGRRRRRATPRRCPTTCRRRTSPSRRRWRWCGRRRPARASWGPTRRPDRRSTWPPAGSGRTCSWARRRRSRPRAPRRRSRSARRCPRASPRRRSTSRTALKLLSLPRALGTHPADGQDVVASVGRFGPVREARQRVPLARGRRRRLHDRPGARAGAARRAEAEPAAAVGRAHGASRTRRARGQRRGGEAARGSLRSVRHRRRDERVAAEGRRPGGDRPARGGRTAEPRGRPRVRRRSRRGAARRGGARKRVGRTRRRHAKRTARACPMAHDPRPRRRPRRVRGRMAGGLARPATSSSTRCGRCARPRCTRPTGSPNSSAATPSAATSSTTPSASSRRRCGGSVRSSCGLPTRCACRPGAALAVDRERFAERMTGEIEAHPRITVVREEVTADSRPRRRRRPRHHRHRSADLAGARRSRSRRSSATSSSPSTTRSARSCWPRRSIGRGCSAHRGGGGASARSSVAAGRGAERDGAGERKHGGLRPAACDDGRGRLPELPVRRQPSTRRSTRR